MQVLDLSLCQVHNFENMLKTASKGSHWQETSFFLIEKSSQTHASDLAPLQCSFKYIIFFFIFPDY
jgi:hypothetical protein